MVNNKINHLHCTKPWDSNGVQGIKYNLEEENEEEKKIVEGTVIPKNRRKKKHD